MEKTRFRGKELGAKCVSKSMVGDIDNSKFWFLASIKLQPTNYRLARNLKTDDKVLRNCKNKKIICKETSN